MQPWLTNWDLPLRGRQLLFYDLWSLSCLLEFHPLPWHLSLMWIHLIFIHDSLIYICTWFGRNDKCLPLDDCCTDPQRWATRASPPPSPRPPAPTEPAACLPPQNATRCKIVWSFFSILKKKNFFIYLYLLSLPTSTSGGYFTSVKWTSSSHFGR